jgi:hypothetical protein
MNLDALRHRTDPLADATLAALVASGGLDAANKTLAKVVLNNSGTLPPDLPGPIKVYFERSGTLPTWADPALMDVGAEIFAEHGPLILVALICASLPECYTMRNGVQVLALTGRMDDTHAYRRIYETAQYVVDVLSPQGLHPEGKGVKAAQKVRLMHAGIRHLILSEPPTEGDPTSRRFIDVLKHTRWDVPTLGLPICQEDELFTLLTFSLVTLRALDAWDVPLTPAQREGWMHRWAVIGHLMGIEDHLIPRTEADAAEVFAAIQAHQVGETPQGRDLTRALSVFFGQVVDNAWLGRQLGPLTIRSMIPAATADLLAVPKPSEAEVWLGRFVRWVVRKFVRNENPILQRFVSRTLVKALTRLPRAWKPGLFQIPTELTTAWSR